MILSDDEMLTADQVLMGIQRGLDEYRRFIKNPIGKITISERCFSVLTSQLDATSTTAMRSEPMTVFGIPVEVAEQQATDFRIWPEAEGKCIEEEVFKLPPVPPIVIKEVTLAHRSYDELSEYIKTHTTIK